VPNFVDTTVFKPRSGGGSGPIKVLYPRRLTPVRGINEFMCAAQALPECEFLLCGQSFSQEAGDMLAEYQQKEQPNMKTIYRPMERMAEVYQEADIAVIPTRAAEGTSLSCLEAMATGLPIVATPAGGLPNLVIDRWNGLLVDLSRDNLLPAIQWLLERPEEMLLFGDRNRQMAIDAFDIEIWKERWRKVIEYVM
jgi:glycosyltransferase involved in cell wall biosynthesis